MALFPLIIINYTLKQKQMRMQAPQQMWGDYTSLNETQRYRASYQLLLTIFTFFTSDGKSVRILTPQVVLMQFDLWCIVATEMQFVLYVNVCVSLQNNRGTRRRQRIYSPCLYVSDMRPLSFSYDVNLLAVKVGKNEHWLKATCLFTEPRLCLHCQLWTAQHGPISPI